MIRVFPLDHNVIGLQYAIISMVFLGVVPLSVGGFGNYLILGSGH